MIRTILVLGGTGMLGLPVARRLHTDGFEVRVLSRSPDRARALLGDACTVVGGDVDEPSSLEAALRGCQGVHISLHGLLDTDLERRGVANVLPFAGKVGIERLTYLSTTSVLPENCWFPPTRMRYEAETSIHASGVPYSIFKTTFIMEALLRFIRGPYAILPGRQPHLWHLLAGADYARMVSRAYALPEAANKDFFIYGPHPPVTVRQALATYCRLVRPEVKLIPVPLWLVTAYVWLGRVLPRTPRRTELKDALPYFRYWETVHEGGDPTEANTLLGAPTTTLEQWCQQEKARLAG
jgi:uncharacterized protein YbjT (DUF2867 family)